MKITILVILTSLFTTGHLIAQRPIEHFFFNVDRHRIQEKSFLDSDIFSGAQLKYTWPELEPKKGGYNFDLIQSGLEILEANGKNLFIQVQDVTFDTTIINVPKYILEDPIYHGGVEIHIGRIKEISNHGRYL